MISSLLHLVGLRPRVYYTLTNFRGGARPPWPPPQYANAGVLLLTYLLITYYLLLLYNVYHTFYCIVRHISRMLLQTKINLLLKMKLMIVCTNVIFDNAQYAKNRTNSDQSYWTIIVSVSQCSYR